MTSITGNITQQPFKWKWTGPVDKSGKFQMFLSNTGPDPLKNHKSIGFLCNTVPDIMKNRKATQPAFNVSLRADGGPLIVVFGSSHQLKKTKKKSCQSRTLSDKTFWTRVCVEVQDARDTCHRNDLLKRRQP